MISQLCVIKLWYYFYWFFPLFTGIIKTKPLLTTWNDKNGNYSKRLLIDVPILHNQTKNKYWNGWKLLLYLQDESGGKGRDINQLEIQGRRGWVEAWESKKGRKEKRKEGSQGKKGRK